MVLKTLWHPFKEREVEEREKRDIIEKQTNKNPKPSMANACNSNTQEAEVKE